MEMKINQGSGFQRMLFAIMWLTFCYVFLWNATTTLPIFISSFGSFMYIFFLPFIILPYIFIEVGWKIYPVDSLEMLVNDAKSIKISSFQDLFLIIFFLVWMSFLLFFVSTSIFINSAFSTMGFFDDPNPKLTSNYLFVIGAGLSIIFWIIKVIFKSKILKTA